MKKGSSEFDCYHLAKACAAEDHRIPVYLACGDQDQLYQDNIVFKDYLKELGFKVTWVSGEGFTLEWRFWNQEVEAFLDWIPRCDSHHISAGHRKI